MKRTIKHLQRSPELQVTHLKRRPNLLAVPSRQLALFRSFAGQGASGHFSLPSSVSSQEENAPHLIRLDGRRACEAKAPSLPVCGSLRCSSGWS